MQPIFLIGFMCSGKTTLGKAISKATGVDFIDLDHYIEAEAGMSVRDIFEKFGEPHFRRLEQNALKNLSQRSDVIVACGGGTPCQPGAMELMNSAGTTILLQPSRDRLVRRLMIGRHKRPLLADVNTPEEMQQRIDSLLAQRNHYYSQAKYTFDSTLLENETEIFASIDEFKRRFFPENQ